ncbi:MAG TPA: pyruvate formate lyase family protein [Desulfomonilia bacterium]|nr:pyruvate formate lyase family protein [Desulfomonilia bacterium]
MRAHTDQKEPDDKKRSPERFERIRGALFSHGVNLCTERALLITEYFKKLDDRTEPMVIRKAKALRHLLQKKSVKIFDDELIVGNMGSFRKSAIMQPELAGVIMSEEILWLGRRKTNPYPLSWADRLNLLFKVIPYWLFRNMTAREFGWYNPKLGRFMLEQLDASYYLINESGGIGHFLPDYAKMISHGIEGYLDTLKEQTDELHAAALIACEGIADYAKRLSREASGLASREPLQARRNELVEIARICDKVPLEPAGTLHEALQSLWLTHVAVCLEGLNSAVSFGRIDQYLYPYYKHDIEAGRLNRDQALELLLCFSAKTTEHMFLLSSRTSEYHGGYLVAQAATVGGMDRNGNDAVNDLTYLFLDVMEISGLRDPNYMARIHAASPEGYVRRALDVARKGNGVPGLFNDEVTVASLASHGYPLKEARNYGVVGCVEPTIPGKSFCSTDAALFNIPVCLILALNRGMRPKSRVRVGALTPDPSAFTSMDHIIDAFKAQLGFMVARLIRDIQVIEKANRDFHPTPFSSMLVQGCLESGKDVTAGGALYNSSGIQGVGVADAADSLAAIDELVFRKKSYTLAQIVESMKQDFKDDPKLRAELLSAPKFGNDHGMPELYADMIVHIFHDALAKHRNTRGGPYVPGFYSSSTHVAFGRRTPSLPSGRKAGEPFAASMGCCNGRDRLGPTALLNSVAAVDSKLAPNGYALNMRFDMTALKGEKALDTITALTKGFFAQGGMEMQLNVLDPEMLLDARSHPGRYPGIVVRVAGYCAYFDDLPDTVKDEIIARTRIELG